jgi:hypothetical protein
MLAFFFRAGSLGSDVVKIVMCKSASASAVRSDDLSMSCWTARFANDNMVSRPKSLVEWSLLGFWG